MTRRVASLARWFGFAAGALSLLGCAAPSAPAPTLALGSARGAFISPVPADQHVLLQGFHWRASSVRGEHGKPRWYGIVSENAQRIADSGFSLVWFPPPSDSLSDEGYLPRRLESLDSAYGSESELRTAIRDLDDRQIGAIADIVINHRVGSDDDATFTRPSWPTNEAISSDDEWPGNKSSHADTGAHYGPARDLDHHSVTVQQGIEGWMRWLQRDVGFAGWRYDMVKGYAGWAVERYNGANPPVFSVGEYLDGDAQTVMSWIDSSHPLAAYRSSAFDFPLYYALEDAVSNRAYERLKFHDKAAGILGLWSEKSVTLVKNHDLEEVRNGEHGPAIPADGRLVQAYAVVLTHPGTPSVFWRDIFDSEHETAIRQLIALRRCYQITSSSRLFIAKAARGDAYAAYIRGIKGELAVKIGPGPWNPEGGQWSPPEQKVLASGGDYAVWGDSGPCPARG